MAEHGPGGPDGDGRFVRLDDGDLYVVEDGPPDAPAVLLQGVGHTPMLEDPQTTGTLLLRFALALKEEKRVGPR